MLKEKCERFVPSRDNKLNPYTNLNKITEWQILLAILQIKFTISETFLGNVVGCFPSSSLKAKRLKQMVQKQIEKGFEVVTKTRLEKVSEQLYLLVDTCSVQ